MIFDCKRLAAFCLLAILIQTGCRSTPRIPSVPGFGWLSHEDDAAVLDRKDPTSTYPPPSASAVPATMPSDGSANVVLPAEPQVAQVSSSANNPTTFASSAPAATRPESQMVSPPGGYPTTGYPATGYPAVDTAPASSTAGSLPSYAADLVGGTPSLPTAAQAQQGLYSAGGVTRPNAADPVARPQSAGSPPQTDLGTGGTPPWGSSSGTNLADSRNSAFPLTPPPVTSSAASMNQAASPAGYAESFPRDGVGYGGGSQIGIAANDASSFQPAGYVAAEPSRSPGMTQSSEPSVYDSMKSAGPWRPGSTSEL